MNELVIANNELVFFIVLNLVFLRTDTLKNTFAQKLSWLNLSLEKALKSHLWICIMFSYR